MKHIIKCWKIPVDMYSRTAGLIGFIRLVIMTYDLANEQLFDLTEEFETSVAVLFDSDKVTLEGKYGDELSLYRARRVWTEVLETNFLLEKGDDFNFRTFSEAESSNFLLTCSFKTACGRYAFWRLVNSQAPESQYLIETAHIPDGVSQHDELLRAPDLKASSTQSGNGKRTRPLSQLSGWFRELFR